MGVSADNSGLGASDIREERLVKCVSEHGSQADSPYSPGIIIARQGRTVPSIQPSDREPATGEKNARRPRVSPTNVPLRKHAIPTPSAPTRRSQHPHPAPYRS